MFKKIVSVLLAATLMASIAVGCKDKPDNPNDPTLTEKDGYMTMSYQKPDRVAPDFSQTETGISVMGTGNGEVGAEMTFSASETIMTSASFIYYLFDFGDGTQSIAGPYEQKVTGTTKHIYRQPGMYEVRVKALAVMGTGATGWSQAFNVSISGDEQKISYIKPKEAIASSGDANTLIDNDAATALVTSEEDMTTYAGLKFDKNYRMTTLEIDTTKTDQFPINFTIQYSTDGGEVWYPLPTHDFSKPDMKMDLPTPNGTRLIINLNGLAANAIKIQAESFAMDKKNILSIAGMRVTGDTEFLFATGMDDTYNADLNNMWNVFGSAVNEPHTAGSNWLPSNEQYFSGGVTGYSVTEWQEWTGLKLNWYADGIERDAHRSSLVSTRVDVDGRGNMGYVWPSEASPKHLEFHYKYSTNPTYIIAVRNYLVSENDPMNNFLSALDSRGKTVLEKVEMAMEYMLEVELGRKEGLLVITDPEHDGTASGGPSNYWDNLTVFGYKSAYENALFYRSLYCMADIYRAAGKEDKAKECEQIAVRVKENYNKLFWDEEKGRYIASVDVNGHRNDFGITFVNFMAIEYGLSDKAKAEKIYEWLDGKRIIEGETSTGADIYKFGHSARSNTIAFESEYPYPWFSVNNAISIAPGGSAVYGTHLENGGPIFYTSYFDLMSRLDMLGSENALGRFNGIMTEFHKDTLRRKPVNSVGANWVEGIIGPFPESGLVPTFIVRGFMGINAEADGLHIEPNIPAEWKSASVNEVAYNKQTYRVETGGDIKKAEIVKEGEKTIIRVPNGEKVVLKTDGTLAK